MIVLEIHGWHTQCGACGYGSGGPYSSRNPARQGKPILDPESTVCHGCGETFTHTLNVYRDMEPQPITEPKAA